MKIINTMTEINKKNKWVAADVQMIALIIALALVSFTTGYFVAMAEIAQAVSAN